MSARKWVILAVLASADLIVVVILGVTVWRSLATPAAPLPTRVVVPAPPLAAVSYPPTWTPTLTFTPPAPPTALPSPTPSLTPTPWPTPTPSPSPLPTPVVLQNPGFEGIRGNVIPGWQTGAFVNWHPGEPFDPDTSFAEPRFHQADDPRQWINGPTLQIDTEPWVKLKAWVYQTVEVIPGTPVQFRVRAFGLVKDPAGGYILRAGIDPDGNVGCEGARWSEAPIYNQNASIVVLTSPRVTAGPAGRVTVCMYAETQYAQVWHAAFFDDAELIVYPVP